MSEEKYTLDELKIKLNEKQKIFCHEYIIEWNITKSYKKAYNIEDDNSAAVSGHKLLSNAKIKQYIEFIKTDYEKEAGISKLSQINGLLEIINDKDASNRDKISARTELNKMLGYNAPEKTEQNITLHDKLKKVGKIDFTE